MKKNGENERYFKKIARIYREEKIILYQGNMKKDEDKIEADYLGNDPFFRTNYDERLIKFGKC